MLTIGQLAAHVGVTVKAVRHYHRLGLLPQPARDDAGYRRYDAQAVIDLTRIKILRDAGIPLRDIPAALRADHDDLSATIDTIERDLDARIDALLSRKALVRQLAAGDSLYLPAPVVTLLDYLRGLGVPEPVVAMERDGWIIWSVTSPDLVIHWAELKLEYLADPAGRDTYMMYAVAAAWSPDDPRLVELAHTFAEGRLAAQAEDAEIDYQQLESLNPTTIALVTDRFATTSPAFARLIELAQQNLDTTDAGKPQTSPRPRRPRSDQQ
jgi:DNA-binding transcriptional MerR regulator